MFTAAEVWRSNFQIPKFQTFMSVSIFRYIFHIECSRALPVSFMWEIMTDVELKARKAAVDFVNAHFTDLESLDRVKDVYDDVYKEHETCRQQLDDQVTDGL